MTTITTRAGKGAPLTNAELDANFTNLNAGKLETTATTSAIAEGANLYFTDARARAAISATGSLSYDASTGVMSFTQGNTDTVAEGTTNKYYTDARARAAISGSTGISYNSATGEIKTTVTQYTDALARAALSFTAGSGGYNSSTGVITIPTNTNQLTNGAGFITGSGSTTGSSGSISNAGGWSVTPSGTKLYFAYNGVNKASLDSSGNLIVVGNVTAYGTA